MEQTTRERVQMLLELASEAAAAPWKVSKRHMTSMHEEWDVFQVDGVTGLMTHREDADFIAASREAIPYLAQKLIEALDVLEQIESWTRNPRAYEPSLYSINHLTRQILEGGDQR